MHQPSKSFINQLKKDKNSSHKKSNSMRVHPPSRLTFNSLLGLARPQNSLLARLSSSASVASQLACLPEYLQMELSPKEVKASELYLAGQSDRPLTPRETNLYVVAVVSLIQHIVKHSPSEDSQVLKSRIDNLVASCQDQVMDCVPTVISFYFKRLAHVYGSLKFFNVQKTILTQYLNFLTSSTSFEPASFVVPTLDHLPSPCPDSNNQGLLSLQQKTMEQAEVMGGLVGCLQTEDSEGRESKESQELVHRLQTLLKEAEEPTLKGYVERELEKAISHLERPSQASSRQPEFLLTTFKGHRRRSSLYIARDKEPAPVSLNQTGGPPPTPPHGDSTERSSQNRDPAEAPSFSLPTAPRPISHSFKLSRKVPASWSPFEVRLSAEKEEKETSKKGIEEILETDRGDRERERRESPPLPPITPTIGDLDNEEAQFLLDLQNNALDGYNDSQGSMIFQKTSKAQKGVLKRLESMKSLKQVEVSQAEKARRAEFGEKRGYSQVLERKEEVKGEGLIDGDEEEDAEDAEEGQSSQQSHKKSRFRLLGLENLKSKSRIEGETESNGLISPQRDPRHSFTSRKDFSKESPQQVSLQFYKNQGKPKQPYISLTDRPSYNKSMSICLRKDSEKEKEFSINRKGSQTVTDNSKLSRFSKKDEIDKAFHSQKRELTGEEVQINRAKERIYGRQKSFKSMKSLNRNSYNIQKKKSADIIDQTDPDGDDEEVNPSLSHPSQPLSSTLPLQKTHSTPPNLPANNLKETPQNPPNIQSSPTNLQNQPFQGQHSPELSLLYRDLERHNNLINMLLNYVLTQQALGTGPQFNHNLNQSSVQANNPMPNLNNISNILNTQNPNPNQNQNQNQQLLTQLLGAALGGTGNYASTNGQGLGGLGTFNVTNLSLNGLNVNNSTFNQGSPSLTPRENPLHQNAASQGAIKETTNGTERMSVGEVSSIKGGNPSTIHQNPTKASKETKEKPIPMGPNISFNQDVNLYKQLLTGIIDTQTLQRRDSMDFTLNNQTANFLNQSKVDGVDSEKQSSQIDPSKAGGKTTILNMIKEGIGSSTSIVGTPPAGRKRKTPGETPKEAETTFRRQRPSKTANLHQIQETTNESPIHKQAQQPVFTESERNFFNRIPVEFTRPSIEEETCIKNCIIQGLLKEKFVEETQPVSRFVTTCLPVFNSPVQEDYCAVSAVMRMSPHKQIEIEVMMQGMISMIEAGDDKKAKTVFKNIKSSKISERDLFELIDSLKLTTYLQLFRGVHSLNSYLKILSKIILGCFRVKIAQENTVELSVEKFNPGLSDTENVSDKRKSSISFAFQPNVTLRICHNYFQFIRVLVISKTDQNLLWFFDINFCEDLFNSIFSSSRPTTAAEEDKVSPEPLREYLEKTVVYSSEESKKAMHSLATEIYHNLIKMLDTLSGEVCYTCAFIKDPEQTGNGYDMLSHSKKSVCLAVYKEKKEEKELILYSRTYLSKVALLATEDSPKGSCITRSKHGSVRGSSRGINTSFRTNKPYRRNMTMKPSPFAPQNVEDSGSEDSSSAETSQVSRTSDDEKSQTLRKTIFRFSLIDKIFGVEYKTLFLNEKYFFMNSLLMMARLSCKHLKQNYQVGEKDPEYYSFEYLPHMFESNYKRLFVSCSSNHKIPLHLTLVSIPGPVQNLPQLHSVSGLGMTPSGYRLQTYSYIQTKCKGVFISLDQAYHSANQTETASPGMAGTNQGQNPIPSAGNLNLDPGVSGFQTLKSIVPSNQNLPPLKPVQSLLQKLSQLTWSEILDLFELETMSEGREEMSLYRSVWGERAQCLLSLDDLCPLWVWQ